jgi:hypothetical protein
MPLFAGEVHYPPAGSGPPWGPSPPSAYPPAVRGIPIHFIPGQLPGETGGGGDTQVGYPDDPEPPATVTPTFAPGTAVVVSYYEAGATPTTYTEGHGAPPIPIYLGAGASGESIPGTIRFTFRNRTYVDRMGQLFYGIDPLTNAGTLGGTMDYENNVAIVTDYGSTGGDTVTLISMGSRLGEWGVDGLMFRTSGSPVRESSFTLRATTMAGVELTATSDVNGNITGTKVKGHIDWDNGLVRVAFGALVTAAGNEAEPWYDADLIDGSGKIWKPEQVDPGSIFHGEVIYRLIPVDPDLVGIDPVRLPTDGRVLAFNPGTVAVISHTQTHSYNPPTAGHVETLRADGRIEYIEVYDSHNPPVPVDDTWYDVNLNAGTLTWANPLNLSGYTLPIIVRDRIQDFALITDVQITGEISLASAVTHDFPDGTIVSNALAFGDMQARVADIFDQETYDEGVWLDIVSGSPAGSTYDSITYPITTTNEGAVDDRWAIVFTSSSAVKVVAEKRGEVETASITNDIAPVNPVTGVPYFFIDKDGWGSGWSAGNVVRFNTISAQAPFWAARVTTPGTITVDEDYVRINAYGNAD